MISSNSASSNFFVLDFASHQIPACVPVLAALALFVQTYLVRVNQLFFE
jgi:hypothetical protein